MNLQTLKLALVGSPSALAVGIGLFTFVYAKGYSYMSNDPHGVCQLPRDERTIQRLAEIKP